MLHIRSETMVLEKNKVSLCKEMPIKIQSLCNTDCKKHAACYYEYEH